MNSLWPAARSSCLQTRTTQPTCRAIDGLVSRLAHGNIRPYSTSSTSFRRREIRPGKFEGEACDWTGNIGLQCSKRFYASRRRVPKILQSSTLPSQPPSNKLPSEAVSRKKKIYTKYVELPADYDDQIGLDYRQDPLMEEEIQAIFGRLLDTDSAERFLRVIHGRRVAGTLPDPDEPSSLAYWEEVAQKNALAWLRKNVPVDEDENAILRAEQELAEIEGGIVEDTNRTDIYIPNVGGGPTRGGKINLNMYKPNDSKEPVEGTKSVYGDSVVDTIRKANEARSAAQEKKRKEEEMSREDAMRQNTGTLDHVKPRSGVELRRKGENPWLKYYTKRAEETAPSVLPELSAFTRLWPSALVVLLTVGASCTFAHIYIPPARAARIFPDIPPAVTTVSALLLANAVVFLFWRHPPAWRLLNKYFIIIPGYPRGLSMIGAMFSHQATSHLFSNMALLAILGVMLHDDIGRANFLAFFLSTGAVSSFASMAWWVWKKNFSSSTLGASGVACAVIAALLWYRRDEEVSSLGITPVISLCLLLGLLGLEVMTWKAVSKGGKQILDHQSHLAGYIAGIIGIEVIRWRERVRKRQAEERRQTAEVMA